MYLLLKKIFGITPVEACACGTPVIAFGKDGALETVRPSHVAEPTGLFFMQQTPEALCSAIHQFEENQASFSAESCRKNKEKFSANDLKKEFSDFVEVKWSEFIQSKQIQY